MQRSQPGTGPIRAAAYLPSTPATVLWGRLPCATDAPVLRIEPGTEVTIDTVSHEGLLDDQGSDPLAFFTGHGVAPDDVLTDAIEIVGTLTRDGRRRSARGDRADPRRGRGAGRPAGDHRAGDHPARAVRRDLQPARPRRAAGRAAARAGERERLRRRCATDHGCLPAVEGGERADRVPAGALPRDHGRRGGRRRAPALGAAGRARRQHRHQPAPGGQHAVPAGAGAGRAGLRGRPALRAGRRRGGAHRAGGVPAGHAAVRRGARRRGARAVRAVRGAAGRDAGVPGADGPRRGPGRGRAQVRPGRARPAAGAVGSRRAPRVRVPVRGHRHRHLAGGRPGLRGPRPDPRWPTSTGSPDDPDRACRRRSTPTSARSRPTTSRRSTTRSRPARTRCAATATACWSGTTPSARSAARAAASRPGCWTGSSPAAWPTTAG